MATSDSEDFESADEEFEIAHSSKSKEDNKKLNIYPIEEVSEIKPASKTTFSDKDYSTALSNRSEDKSISKNIVKEEPSVEVITNEKEIVTDNLSHESSTSTREKSTTSEAVKSSNKKMTNMERQALKAEMKQKSGTRKLGSKLSNIINKNAGEIESSKELLNINNDQQNPPIPHSDAISDTKSKELVKTVKNESLKENSSKFVKSDNIVNEETSNDLQVEQNPSVISEPKTIQVTSIESKKKSLSPDIIPKSASGDGWEVEEEDGFEVPVSLSTKPKNEIIQSEREISPVLERLSANVSQSETKGQGWGSWGGWGVTSLLSSATESVSTFSSHVSSGLSTVLENSLGVPDPEELAKHVVQEEKEKGSNKVEETTSTTVEDTDEKEVVGFSGLGSLMSGVSLLGTKVLSGGLDTLETLGKKTMEVLQEGDPMLRKKRAMLFHDPDKPVLSQILKEAKEKAENNDKEQAEKEASRKAHFETLFDDYQGLVHLEALEMLSKQCQLKLQSILLSYSGDALLDLQETLSEVKELCELPEDEEDEAVLTKDEFETKITECMKNLHPNLSPAKIVQVYDLIDNQLKEFGVEKMPAVEIHQKAISSMAEFTASAMECFHKGAELVLTKTHRSTADEAENFVLLTTTFCGQVSSIAREFTCLLTKWDPIANSTYITNTFLEAGNSVSYIQNACELLLPVIQVGAAS